MGNLVDNILRSLEKLMPYYLVMVLKNLTVLFAGLYFGGLWFVYYVIKLVMDSNLYWLETNPDYKELLEEHEDFANSVALIRLEYNNHVKTYARRPHGIMEGIDLLLAIRHAKKHARGQKRLTVFKVDYRRSKRMFLFWLILTFFVAVFGALAIFHIHMPPPDGNPPF